MHASASSIHKSVHMRVSNMYPWLDDKPQVPEPGGLVAFPGDCSHGGMPITGGTRYIIAAFLYVLE